MAVDVIEPGRRVRVTPDAPNGADVLEYAEALIEEEGWNPGVREGAPYQESSPSTGWTLHDAVGEANRRLFREGGKEGIMIEGGTTRSVAQTAIGTVLGDATDMQFNDKAANAEEVLAVLRQAREVVTT